MSKKPKTAKALDQRENTLSQAFYDSIKQLIESARGQVVRSVNQVMAETYWRLGYMIVEEEQKGQERAEYGKKQ